MFFGLVTHTYISIWFNYNTFWFEFLHTYAFVNKEPDINKNKITQNIFL